MIRTNNGDILKSSYGYIINTCYSDKVNCSNLFESIAEKWPQVKQSYHEFYSERGYLNLGEFQIVPVTDELSVVNIITQDDYGYDGRVYVSYAAIEVGLHGLVNHIYRHDLEKIIHFPKIGCGLAGGDWEVVKEIINRIVPDDFKKVFWDYA